MKYCEACRMWLNDSDFVLGRCKYCEAMKQAMEASGGDAI